MFRKITVSAVIPVFNEAKNIPPLYQKLKKGLAKVSKKFEIIFINDGSSDGSEAVLEEIYQQDRRISIISFEKNYGKTAALEAGINLARGQLIVTLDGDLQHDPEEIPKLVKKIDQGFDLVTGWRKKRQDSFYRIVFSKLVNLCLSLLTGFKIHDFYCGFKCFKRKVVKTLALYGDLYRFIAYLAYRRGFKVAEVPVAYHYRKFGRSKYDHKLIKRTIYDLLIILFVIRRLQRGEYRIKRVLKKR